MKILVVDDEQLLVKGIKFNLTNEGYDVLTGSDGLEAVEIAKRENVDLIILDLMMPNLDGYGACQKIREFSDAPIIMLTAKADDMDKLMGFEHGADDYLTKPFNILELKARIRAQLRRSTARTSSRSNRLTYGPITIDASERNAYKNDQLVELTVKEFDLIELLMRNPGRLISTELFLEKVWGYDAESDISVVWVYLSNLRKKMASIGANVQIKATRGAGYLLEEIT